MSVELTAEQLEAAKGGQPLRFRAQDTEYVVLRADLYDRVKELLEDEEDRKLQEAFLKASHQSAVSWMKENPY